MPLLKRDISKVELTLRYLFPLLAYFALMIVLTSLPSDDVPVLPFPYYDKVAHFGLYFGFGLLLTRMASLGLGRKNLPKVILAGILIVAVYGALDEYGIQRLAEGRQLDGNDYLMNLLGGSCGASSILIYLRFRSRFIH